MSPCHPVALTFYHLVTLVNCHSLTLSLSYLVTLSHHVINSPFICTITLSHFLTLSISHLVYLSPWQPLTLSTAPCQPLTLSNFKTCQHLILTTSNLVYLPPCLPLTLSTSHFVNLSLCLLLTSSTSHLVYLSPCQPLNLSTSHLVNLSPCIPFTLSTSHLVYFSTCQPLTLSTSHLVTLSPCTLSPCFNLITLSAWHACSHMLSGTNCAFLHCVVVKIDELKFTSSSYWVRKQTNFAKTVAKILRKCAIKLEYIFFIFYRPADTDTRAGLVAVCLSWWGEHIFSGPNTGKSWTACF